LKALPDQRSVPHAPETTFRERKEIVRCLIDRVELALSPGEQPVEVVIRWAGGFESRHKMHRPVWRYEQLDEFEPLLARLGELRRAGWRAPRIAKQLNTEGFRTPKQRGLFTDDVVRKLFPRLGSDMRRRNRTDLQPPQWSADALAERLKIPVKKLKDWARCGWVQVIERPFGGVWILHADNQQLEQLERRVRLSVRGRRYPAQLAIANQPQAASADNLK